jgi:tRNA(Leu) C34 or U34 (ribose-2'-O)-methylase TrmL
MKIDKKNAYVVRHFHSTPRNNEEIYFVQGKESHGICPECMEKMLPEATRPKPTWMKRVDYALIAGAVAVFIYGIYTLHQLSNQ